MVNAQISLQTAADAAFFAAVAQYALRSGSLWAKIRRFPAPVAQLEECRFPKPEVTGSIPVGCASIHNSQAFMGLGCWLMADCLTYRKPIP